MEAYIPPSISSRAHTEAPIQREHQNLNIITFKNARPQNEGHTLYGKTKQNKTKRNKQTNKEKKIHIALSKRQNFAHKPFPPSSAFSNMPILPRAHPLFRTRTRRLGFYAGTLVAAGTAFDQCNYNVLSRSLRTIVGGAYIVYLYKLTTPKNLYELNELHAEAARTVRDICLTNEGLYIKLGQLISSMNSAVPPVVIDILKVLLDDAPKVDGDVVKAILARELAGAEANQKAWMARHGERVAERERFREAAKAPSARDGSAKHPEGVLFDNLTAHWEAKASREKNNNSSITNTTTNSSSGSAVPPELAPFFIAFDETPIASASIAQVHRAVIADPITGAPTPVAVKVLKPAIRTQIWYDCACHTLLTHAIERLFGIPITHNNATIDRNLTRETDFYVEAAHTDLLRGCLANRRDAYIPRVYYEYLTDQVMVTEWIDAVKLSEAPRVKSEIVGRGIASYAGLMTTLIESFGEMVFAHGAVNCDPHPANLMVRPHPKHPDTIRDVKRRYEAEDKAYAAALAAHAAAATTSSDSSSAGAPLPTPPAPRAPLPTPDLRAPRHQLVLLDHGLCVTFSDTFRYEYGLFFRALLGRDTADLTRLVQRWGVADTDLFVSMTLQKPYKSEGGEDASSSSTPNKPPAAPGGFFSEGTNRRYSPEELAAMQQMMKDRLAKFLADKELMPKEMLFVGRSFNYLRGINKSFGAPVNRLKITAECAFAALDEARIGTLSDLELWEKSGRSGPAYLAARRALRMDTFSTSVAAMRRRFAVAMALAWLDLFQIVVTFYNTVVVPIIAMPIVATVGNRRRQKEGGSNADASDDSDGPNEWVYRRLRIGTMEDVLEAREAQMSERLWGPGGGANGGGDDEKPPQFVPDIGVND